MVMHAKQDILSSFWVNTLEFDFDPTYLRQVLVCGHSGHTASEMAGGLG